jgi:hypothetical protein
MAQALALRLAREVPGEASAQLDARIRRAYLLCLSREPLARELELLRGYFTRQQTEFANDESAAEQLATEELIKLTDKPTAAALVCLARAVLNTANFIMRE